MNKYVLDASAILAFLNQEVGSARVTDIIQNSVISAINLSEVISKLIEIKMPEEEIILVLAYLNCEVIPYKIDDAWETAKLRPLTRQKGLSLGDRACLALAQKLKLTAVTADKAWASLSLDVSIEVIR